MNVLVVGDDYEARQQLVDQLIAEDVDRVYEAANFEEALAVIRDADGIVCDAPFPIRKGEPAFELAWIGMRAAARAFRRPFVLVTEDEDMKLEALHEDTDAYLKAEAPEAIGDLVHALKGEFAIA
ncbi:MAG TPA: hypothetical protein VMI06_19905 [Terriglobia bacterium]|nr:hypothetical protein [Terriglobia bacterium]